MSTFSPSISKTPVIADGNLDYVEGNSYSVEIVPDGSIHGDRHIKHTLSGRNLVRSLIEDKQAKFACVVSATWCSYRSVEDDVNISLLQPDQIVAEQILKNQTENYANPVMYQPMIIANQDVKELCLSENHGVHHLWVGEVVNITKGTKLAIGPYHHSSSLLQSIFQVKVDQNLPKGCFEVIGVPEQGFYFVINASEDLFKSLQHPGNSINHCNSIYCFALSQALDILKHEYCEERSWDDHINLRHLYQHLQTLEEGTWDQTEFSANRAVAKWLPHEIDPMND